MSVRKGDDGAAVILVQGILYNLDYEITGVDGIFGDETDAAVRSFQGDNELDVDGVVGEDTANAMVSSLWYEEDADESVDYS